MDAINKFRMDVEYQIDSHADRLETPDEIVAKAKDLYDSFNHEDAAYSRPDSVYALAALHLAYKIHDEPILIRELLEGTDANKKHVIRAYKEIQGRLAKEHGLKFQTFSPESFIDKFTTELSLPDSTATRAKEILSETEEKIQNYASNTQAASSLYLAATLENDDVDLNSVSEVSDTSEVTIRSRSREQMEELSVDTEL